MSIETTPLLRSRHSTSALYNLDVEENNGKQHSSSPHTGKILITTATILFALNIVGTKFLYNDGVPPTQANFYISIWQMLNTALALWTQGENLLPSKHQLKNTAITGCLIALLNVLWLFSIFFADAGNCSAFLGVLPLVTACLAYLILSDYIPIYSFSLTSIGCFISLIMIVQPPFIFKGSSTTLRELFGYILMTATIFSYAILAIFQRSHSTHPTRSTFAGGFFMTLSYLTITFVDSPWIQSTLMHHILIFGISLMKTTAYWGITKGCSITQPTMSSLLFLLEIPATYIMETLILGTVLNWLTYSGVVLMLLTVGAYLIHTGSENIHGGG